MKSFIKITILALAIMLPALAGLTVRITIVSAQENEQQANTTEEQSNTYEYVAQPGDSYSLIARKAVQTYGLIHSVNLSEAQIIAAETYLTQTAGSPELNEGSDVAINESTIKSQIEKAQALSEGVLGLWQRYADNANFNTNNVGE